MDEVRLNWAQANVKDSELTVALEGKPPSGWKESFERTVRLLGDGEWGAVELKKEAVLVQDIQPGVEDKLRHYLESVVEQANSAHRKEPEESDEDGSKPEGPDAEMTERFRAFAENDEDGESGQDDG